MTGFKDHPGTVQRTRLCHEELRGQGGERPEQRAPGRTVRGCLHRAVQPAAVPEDRPDG